MLRTVLRCVRLSGPLRRSVCTQHTPLYPRKLSVANELGSVAVQPVGSSIQKLVAEITAIRHEVEDLGRSMDILMKLAGEVKENEEICSLFCSQQIVCEAERDFSYLFIRSQCGDGTGDEKYIYVNSNGEITSAALNLPEIPAAVVKEVTIHMPPSQLESPVEVHLYLSNGYLLACAQDPNRTNTIGTLKGIENVVDSTTWFLRDPITMGTPVAFLRPFASQQLVVHCTTNTPLRLDNENTHPTPNLRFQAILA